MTKLRVLDLFSGIGGFSLGLERTGGFETAAFCEIEPYPRAVLAKHWPGVPIYDDVRTLTADALRRDGIAVDVICGGFPCQDISLAGKRSGLEGARSGLWREYARLVGELRPRFVIVENVAGLLNLGMADVLGDLAALGYDATWDCIPAAAVGAPHRRDRIWIIAYANGGRPHAEQERVCQCSDQVHASRDGALRHVADADSRRRKARNRNLSTAGYGNSTTASGSNELCNADRQSLAVGKSIIRNDAKKFSPVVGADWWATEPDVGRVAHGVPSRVDRLKGLGNAVVPQIPELIGRAILKAEGLAA